MSLWGVNDDSQPSAQRSLGDLCKDNKPGSEGYSPRCECVGRELGGTFSMAASSAASGLGFTDENSAEQGPVSHGPPLPVLPPCPCRHLRNNEQLFLKMMVVLFYVCLFRECSAAYFLHS